MKATAPPATVNDYIAAQPAELQPLLEQVRATIRKAAPDAEEVISYGMPAYKQHQVLVYFAGYKKHIGFYPTGSGIEAFKDKFTDYKWSKGAVQFPLDAPLPLALITKMVKFRMKDDAQRMKEKMAAKKK